MTVPGQKRWKRRIGRRFYTLLAGGLLGLILFGWWNSSRYSERYLHYIGTRSVELFSASSLIRVSLADGHIGSPGRQKGYRQRNARGKLLIRPLSPTFRSGGGLWEITFGYWHLAALGLFGLGVGVWMDWRRAVR